MPHDDHPQDDSSDNLRIDRPRDDPVIAQLAHWGGFLTGFILPLVLYLVQQDKRSFAAWHARESLNFQISLMFYYGLGCVPMCLLFIDMSLLFIGLAITLLLMMFELVCIILASLAVARGERYRYPLTIPFVSRTSDDRNPYDDRQ